MLSHIRLFYVYITRKKNHYKNTGDIILLKFCFLYIFLIIEIVGDCVSFHNIPTYVYYTQQKDLQEGGKLNLYVFPYIYRKKVDSFSLKLMQFILSQKFTKFSQKENFKLILQLCCGLSVKLMCSCLIKKLNIIEKSYFCWI